MMRAAPSVLVRSLATFAMTVLTSIAPPACAESIVADGKPNAQIVIATQAPVEVARAAKELQTYVQRVSGAVLPITFDGIPSSEAFQIRLRTVPVSASRDAAHEIVHPDGYRIRSAGHVIEIAGGSPRGVLYGTYDFIERVLDVRWFMPTAMGEDIVERKTIPSPALSVIKNPAFPNISGFSWGGSVGAEEWELRMRMRIGRSESFGHNWYNIFPASKENLAAHPEMFAMVGGSRGRSTQLCSSNPAVVQATVDAARAHFAKDPSSNLFSISPNDGAGWCECDECRKIDALYGVGDGSLADRFVHYANAVLTELEKTNPEKEVGIYAYAEHTAPPLRAKPRAGYATAVAHMPWEFCHVHAIDDPSCPANRRFLEYLKGWSGLTKHSGVYEYYGHFFMFTPWPIVHSMRRDIPLFKKMGIERIISETQQNWANQGINFYVAARLMNDPGTDVDALLAEYFTRFYGKAAAPMRRYFDLFEEAMQHTEAAGDYGYAWISMFTPDLVKQAAAMLKEAERLAGADAERFRTRVAFARAGFRFTEAFANMLDSALRKDFKACFEWAEEAQKRIKATEGSAPQAFYVSLAIDTTRFLAYNMLPSGVAPWVALRPRKPSN